jgi:TRAP-type C4-dicarboxylate transport system permease small subunit
MVVADVINLLCKNVRITDAVSMLEKILTLALNILFFSWAFKYILFSMGLSALSPILKIPFYIVHWSVVFGLGMMMIYNFVHMIERFLELKNKYFRAAPEIAEGGDR